MAISIQPYREEHVPAMKEFNSRLREGGAAEEYSFPESAVLPWLPASGDSSIYNNAYVALDGSTVRGAFEIKHQPFSLRGDVCSLGYYHHPLSEGIVNRAWTQVGLQMMMAALRTQPLLYALGMGGYERPLPRMLMAMKWSHMLVPFRFKVHHPARFLRQIQRLRTSTSRRWVANLAAASGTGWLAIEGMQWRGRTRATRGLSFAIVEQLPGWADELWNACRNLYGLIAVRDLKSLAVLYPRANRRILRVEVTRGSMPIGWAVVADVQKNAHPEYGDMRVGYILDGLAHPENAGAVIAAATSVLEERGVDMIQSNQSHSAWVSALDQAGFLKRPSNFIFAAAPKLASKLEPFEATVAASHFNRSDGDGLYQYV